MSRVARGGTRSVMAKQSAKKALGDTCTDYYIFTKPDYYSLSIEKLTHVMKESVV
jgi:hypothetical protein